MNLKLRAYRRLPAVCLQNRQRLPGLLILALVVVGSVLTLGVWLASFVSAAPQAHSKLALLPAATALHVDVPLHGTVALAWGTIGTHSGQLTAPTETELAELPDLGELDLGFLLQAQAEGNVTGYVDLRTTLVFTGYHTVDVSLTNTTTTMVVGPEVNGAYKDGVLTLLSERFAYTTEAGQAVERQFRLIGSPSPNAGIVRGEYRETVWGYGLQPLTIVGTFDLRDLNLGAARVNRTPVAHASTVRTKPETAVAVTLTGADADGDAMTYAIITNPVHGTLSGAAPDLTYTPNPGFAGTDSFTYKVNDGTTDSATVAITINVSLTNNTGGQTNINLPLIMR